MKEFAKRLKRERELRSWSQEHLAELIGTTAPNVSRWERAITLPGLYFRQKLCELFGKTPDELGLAQYIAAADPRQVGSVGFDEQEAHVLPELPALYDPLIPFSLATPHSLIGRDSLLAHLKGCLYHRDRTGTFTALSGLPGVGKTALAVAFVRDCDLLKHFRDGVLWVGLGTEPNVLGQLSRWGTLLGIAPGEMVQLHSIAAWAERLCTVIGRRRMLLVLDDAWETEHALAFKVGGPQCAYLVTTRFPHIALSLAGSGAIAVDELNEQESIQLLEQFAPHVVSREPQTARNLVNAVGGLPLALTLMGKYLYVQGHGEQPRRLQAALNRLQDAEECLRLTEPRAFVERSPSQSGDPTISLQSAIAVSDRRLPLPAQRALRALAIFPPKPNSFSEEAAIAVCAQPVEVLDTLLDAGILESPGPGHYTVHQTIANYARAHLSEDAVYQRLIDYAVRYVHLHPREYEALEWESSTILAALRIASERGMFAEFVQGVMSFIHFLQLRGLNTLAEKLLQASRATVAPEESERRVVILLRLGETAEKRGNFAQAETYLLEGLALARRREDCRQISALLLVLGLVAANQEDYAQAMTYLHEGLALARQIGDREIICDHLIRLSIQECVLENLVQAEAHGQEGLLLARQLEDRDRISHALWSLALAATTRGDYAKAEAYYQEALELARQTGHCERISHVLTNLAGIMEEQGYRLQAEVYYQEALELARRIGFCIGLRCHLLTALGRLAANRGDGMQTEIYYAEGLLLARQEGNSERTVNLLISLASLEVERGNAEQATVYSQEALTLARQLGLPGLIGGILSEWGEIQCKQQHFEEASKSFREALASIPEEYQTMVAAVQYGLARTAAAGDNLLEARQLGEASLIVFEATGHDKASEVRHWLGALPVKANC